MRKAFSLQTPSQCFTCAIGQLDIVVRTVLSYLDEPDYRVAKLFPDGGLELETYCYRILVKPVEGRFTVCPQMLGIKECNERYERSRAESRKPEHCDNAHGVYGP